MFRINSAVITILAVTTIPAEQYGYYFKLEENTFLSHPNTVWRGNVGSLLSCSLMCARQDICKSANFMAGGGACSLYKETRTRNIDSLVPYPQGSFYIEKVL